MNERLSKLLSELIEIHASGKVDVCFNFSGHVQLIDLRVYIPKWENNKEADFKACASINVPQSFEKFENEVDVFIKLFKFLDGKQ